MDDASGDATATSVEATSETQLLALGGSVIAYRVSGSGPTCVLVCGAGGTKDRFDTVIGPAFRQAGFRTLVYDPRGIGESSDVGTAFDIADQCDDLIALLEQHGEAPYFLFGISMGAFISQEVALLRPDLVRAAALVATVAEQGEFIRRHFRVVIDHESGRRPLPPEVMDLYQATTLFSPTTLNDDEKSRGLLDLWSRGNVQTGPAFARQIECNARYEGRLDALRGISRPCLVVSYEHDLCAPAVRGRELAAAIPGAEFCLIRDAGHLGIVEKKDETLDAALAFFTRFREDADDITPRSVDHG